MKKAMFWIAGLFSGILLGFMLKGVQSFSGHNVYRLLLNADYVPVLKEFRLSEFTEFVIHLVISAVLVAVLGIFWQYVYRSSRSGYTARKVIVGTTLISIGIGAALYPTTLLSSGGTPPIDSIPAWFWWLLAHGIYGAVSGVLIYRIQTRKG